MKLRPNSITSTLTLFVCTALLLLAAPVLATDYVWDGNGDANNGGVWSDPANWDHGTEIPDDSSDEADFTASLTSDRFISNDVATTIGTIVMEDHTRHHLWLDADLYVDTIDGGHDKYKSHIHVNGQTLTAGRVIGPGAYMVALDGPGTFIKATTGTVKFQGEDEYTGTMIVSNGTLQFRSALWDTTTLMTVLDGATAEHISSGADFPTNIHINGFGFNNNGAMKFSTTETCASDITVNTDSKMKTSSTATLTGDIRGTGCLTLEGSTWLLAGTGVTYTNTLKITNGTVQVSGSFPNLLNVVVDGGGVLEALPSQFPVASIVTQNGGVWNLPTSAAWTGNGDGSNWTDTANWAPAVVPTEQADLRQSLSSPRYIAIDSNATVDTILMEDDTDNNIVLQANLTVDTFGNEHNIYNSRVDVNGHTFIAGRSTSANNYFVKLDGDGTFIKNTTGTCTLQTEDEFTGYIIVSNGVLNFRSQLWDTTVLLTVLDGGRANLMSAGADFPTNIVINGSGSGGAGALSWSAADSHASDITVNTDSTIKRSSGTTTLSGEISGPGDLTCDAGTGTFDLDGTYNFAISGAAANKIIAGGGDIDINGATLSVSGEAGATSNEYVIIDYSGAGTVTGEFGSTNDLAGGWSVDYDGTATYADSVVLVSSPTYPPDIETTAATNITETSAYLNGSLDDQGGSPADVYVFYGTTDGTTNKTGADAWNTSALVKASAPLGAVTYQAGSLNDEEVYFYRYYASNTTHDAWSTNSASFLPDEVTITKTGDAIEENTIPGTFTVHRAASATNGAITVNFTVSGTATADVHYVDNLGTSVTLAEGQSSAEIVVTPVTNLTTTHDTTVTVTLDTGLYLVGAPGSADLTIVNYEPPDPGTNFTWYGNGNANNGGDWSDEANWDSGDGTPGNDGYPDVANDTVDLTPNPGVVRYISNDVATTVGTITIAATANSRLVLDADLTVDTIAGAHDTYKSPIDLNGNTLTVGQNTSIYMAQLKGSGEFVKVSTGSVQLQGEDNYTGSIIVSNGVLYFRAPSWDVTSLMTVIDGATAWQNSTGGDLPTNIVINGAGFNNGGAVRFSVTDNCVSEFMVSSDSKMKQSSGTTTLSGDIKGTGCLMLEGPGTWILGGTDMTYTNKLIVTNGTTQLTGNFPDLINILVDQGGVLEAVPTQFPSASVVTQNGGIWNIATSATWTGNGDGSNWTDTANWAPPIIPTDQADLRQTLTSPRYIAIDADSTVTTILMEDDTDNNIVLQSDLTVDTFGNEHNIYNSRVDVNGHTFTAGRSTSANNYFVKLDGSGTFIKNTTGTCTLQTEDEFTGSIIVSNGTLKFRSQAWDTTILMTVLDGATANLFSGGADFPTNIVINGTGYSSQGALSWSVTDSHASDITVNTDSTIKRGSGTTTLSGEISGPGDLTLDAGTGTFDLDGTYNLAISGAAANNMIADSGSINISDATLDVANETGASELEYVIIDYSGSGTVVGQFSATNDLDAGWEVEYAGTATNPNAVVLVKTASDATTVLMFE